MKILFVFLFVYLSLTASSQTLVINEVMASNAATIADEDGDDVAPEVPVIGW